ncbi:MAG: sigma-54-dependent Fis family transcriptional regulator [Candidatus Abyssobacteria bacterium SURF_5]|uniref:Sigma-54-dependent Fis family transcriptional regulator n=1 Tax=Abyssobacteria bacterium (strain SURF_5) TaxID=2093360 RepID=A0A3A4NFF3_ABYX5|nr:MAG: sigma-54-dependent Fis family transcriptional regulator [Candidatus Abyssubacteria bacterium SURF_5]
MEKDNVRILIVDDEQIVVRSLSDWFRDDGYSVGTASTAKEALAKLTEREWDIYLLDVKMPGMSGLELQKKIREINPDSIIIIMTAYASVDSAVEALKQGAYDYLTKPFDPEHLGHLIRNALEKKTLAVENSRLKQSIDESVLSHNIIGASEGIKKVIESIETVSNTETSVLIRGESGTGKELVAKAIHSNSRRRYMPMIILNCGALAESILESELFGHEKGAFTGAQYKRKGKFELADGGTLFLDEIGDISQKMQMDLLRVLDEKKIRRIGGEKEIAVDFRLIAATNKDLEAAVEAGVFRSDLYYRLNVFSVTIPPLRQRPSDIPLLAEHFLKKYAQTTNKHIEKIADEALEKLTGYTWPGNVRELENAIERAVVVCKSDCIKEEHFPFSASRPNHTPIGRSLEDMEQEHIFNTLTETQWNITQTARLLNIDRVTLYRKIKKYKLKKKSSSSQEFVG